MPNDDGLTGPKRAQTGLRFDISNDPMFAENGYIVFPAEGGPCWIVDPGLPPQAEQMLAFISENDLVAGAIVLTHAHVDHIAGIDEIIAELGDLPVYLAQEEWPALTDPNENLSAALGTPIVIHAQDVRDLPVGGQLKLGQTEWAIGDVSGHSPGGRSLYCAEHSVVIVGDGIFAGSVGRVDFHHSRPDKYIDNLRKTLMSLPDETRVLCGHGPETTIGKERTTNPYILHGL